MSETPSSRNNIVSIKYHLLTTNPLTLKVARQKVEDVVGSADKIPYSEFIQGPVRIALAETLGPHHFAPNFNDNANLIEIHERPYDTEDVNLPVDQPEQIIWFGISEKTGQVVEDIPANDDEEVFDYMEGESNQSFATASEDVDDGRPDPQDKYWTTSDEWGDYFRKKIS
ncbi:hypothetical protein ACFL6I_22250 [candidate division KSB1 bacterium]